MEPFDKSVYVNIERMLRNSSKDKEANEIFKAMQKTSLRTEKSRNLLLKFLRTLYNLITDYGTNYWRPSIIWLSCFFISFLLLRNPKNIILRESASNLFVIKNNSVTSLSPYASLYEKVKGKQASDTASTTYKVLNINRSQVSPGDWGTKNGLLMASRYCIPFVEIYVEDEWKAAANIEWMIFLCAVFSYISLTVVLYGVADKAFRKM